MKKDDKGALSPKQKKILKRLLAELRILKRFDGRTFEEMQRLVRKEEDIFVYHREDYEETMLKAIRAGLATHPRIIRRGPLKRLFWEYIRTHRLLGNWKLLRKVRGLEVGVKRPHTREQAEFLNAVYDVINELRWGGRKPEVFLEAGGNEVSSKPGRSIIEDALQGARQSRVFEPENPPPQPREKPVSISEIHRELTRKGIVKSKLQPFIRRLERLDPHFRSRKKRKKIKG